MNQSKFSYDELFDAIDKKNIPEIKTISSYRPKFRIKSQEVMENLEKVSDQNVIEALNLTKDEKNAVLAYALSNDNGVTMSCETIKRYLDGGVNLKNVELLMKSLVDDEYPGTILAWITDPASIKLLIDRKANYDVVGDFVNAQTTIPKTTTDKIIKSVEVLLEAGADINKPPTKEIFPGETAVGMSIQKPALFHYLLSKNADVTRLMNGKPLQAHILKKIMSNFKDGSGDTIRDYLAMFNEVQGKNQLDINQLLIPYHKQDLNSFSKDFLKNQLGADLALFKITSPWEDLSEKKPNLASNVEWFGPDMMPEEGFSKPGKWFYNTRDTNKDSEIIRVYDESLLTNIKNKENPFTRQKWDGKTLARFSVGETIGGGKEYHQHHGRKYLVRRGPRGGRYILVKGEKLRI